MDPRYKATRETQLENLTDSLNNIEKFCDNLLLMFSKWDKNITLCKNDAVPSTVINNTDPNETPNKKPNNKKRRRRRRKQLSSSATDDANDAINDFWLLPSYKKLEIYEAARSRFDKTKTNEIPISFPSLQSRLTEKQQESRILSYAEQIKLKRDMKRRSLKYRTTKTPPLSYTEELRALIVLQTETWMQCLRTDKHKTR